MEVGQRARAHVPHPLRPYEPLMCASTNGRDVTELERRADVLELSGDAR